MWEGHFAMRPAIAGKLLSAVETSDVYGWLAEVAEQDRNKRGEPLKRNTLHHIKSFLSGVFTLAKCHGYFKGENPVRGAILPEAPEASETYAYSLEEIASMLAVLPEPARTMVATASFTGLRRSEFRGLVWEGYGNGELRVTRSIVEGEIQEPKTRASKAAVPLLPSLAAVLDMHRQRDGEPTSGPIFRTSLKTAIDPNNVLNRQILPALNRCAICKRSETEHSAKLTHEYRRDQALPEWHGWHAFRRGLGTNLYRLGVTDKTVQGILRHSDVATTMAYYVKPLAADSVNAMKALDSVLCLNCAPEVTGTARLLTQ
jgi:integrase